MPDSCHPADGFLGVNRVSAYGAKSQEDGGTLPAATASQFNTRPNTAATVAKKSSTGSNSNGGGSRSSLKRPTTSTIRGRSEVSEMP